MQTGGRGETTAEKAEEGHVHAAHRILENDICPETNYDRTHAQNSTIYIFSSHLCDNIRII